MIPTVSLRSWWELELLHLSEGWSWLSVSHCTASLPTTVSAASCRGRHLLSFAEISVNSLLVHMHVAPLGPANTICFSFWRSAHSSAFRWARKVCSTLVLLWSSWEQQGTWFQEVSVLGADPGHMLCTCIRTCQHTPQPHWGRAGNMYNMFDITGRDISHPHLF